MTTKPAARPPRATVDLYLSAMATIIMVTIVGAVIAYKTTLIQHIPTTPFFSIYGLVVVGYIVSRFALSLFYRPCPDMGLKPTLAVVMPAFNEEGAITTSITALLGSDYPPSKMEIVVVNDGSTDRTGQQIDQMARRDPRVRVIHFPENRGKRAAMAAGIRATEAEVIAFVDSDSVLERSSLRALVQDFKDPRVNAVAGHADVLNEDRSFLTRMQAVRYFVAFRVSKAAESVFGAVTCCSGCFSAYRRSAIMPGLSEWENQTFLGRAATFGDDRALTNLVLRTGLVRYNRNAISRTLVPEEYSKFLRQQLRWKRSWTRESLSAMRIMWRKHPAAALATYIGVALPIISPLVAIRALAIRPVLDDTGPWVYILGLYSTALLFGLYYEAANRRGDRMWFYGVGFVFFYVAVLVWQTYWALLTARRNDWGTRSTAPVQK
jgi:hyaluronan synthase